MPADELTMAERALLDQNWRAANDALDELLTMLRRHKADDDCTDWFCCSEELVEKLLDYEEFQTSMMLRVAMERLAIL